MPGGGHETSQVRSRKARSLSGPGLFTPTETTMKTFLPLALLPFCTLAFAGPEPDQAPAMSSPDELGFDELCGCGKAEMLRRRFLAGLPINDFDGGAAGGGGGGGGYHAREAMTDTDVLGNVLDIELLPATTTITG